MAMKIDCPECNKRILIDEGFAGGVCRCPYCKALAFVPGEMGATSAGKRPDAPTARPEARTTRTEADAGETRQCSRPSPKLGFGQACAEPSPQAPGADNSAASAPVRTAPRQTVKTAATDLRFDNASLFAARP